MKTQKLTISFRNLLNNQESDVLITASNPFMLLNKVNNFVNRDIWINGWGLINNKWQAGNNGLNAEAYLWETLEELN
jgi:hypothetical protein